MTPEQCSSARAWLAWSQDELAKAAKVGLSTVKDFETGKRAPIPSTQTAMRVVLEREGIGFSFAIDDDGVKLRMRDHLFRATKKHGALDGIAGFVYKREVKTGGVEPRGRPWIGAPGHRPYRPHTDIESHAGNAAFDVMYLTASCCHVPPTFLPQTGASAVKSPPAPPSRGFLFRPKP